jgi:hypothetical protein
MDRGLLSHSASRLESIVSDHMVGASLRSSAKSLASRIEVSP